MTDILLHYRQTAIARTLLLVAFDLLLKNGTIIDGSGKPRFRGDIGVRDGIISDVGSIPIAKAQTKKVVSAEGKFVVPGFVDITSHADKNWSLFLNPNQDYLLTQGVTTILGGNCGTSLAPLLSPSAMTALRKWDHGGPIAINWSGVGEFLDELEQHPLGVNFGTLIGHGTIRRGILGDEARQLEPGEFQQSMELLATSVKEGAFGLSAGLIYGHESPATQKELVGFGTVLAASGSVLKLHLRHEGYDLIAAVNEAIGISRETRCRVIISHFKAVGRKAWPHFKQALGMIERANAENAAVSFDISPYGRTGSMLYLFLPAWAREGGFSKILERIADPKTHLHLIAALKKQTIRANRYVVMNSAVSTVNGKTIAEIASRAGQSPEETILELLLANRGRVTVFGKTLSFRNLTLGVAHPLGIIASDGNGVSPALGKSGRLVHPRSTGCFPHFLHKFVREQQLLSWEEGIRKITSLPAEIVGFKERGRIEKGYHADLVIFDPETIRDRSSYQNPYVHPVGIEAVIVNGKLAIENGQLTGIAAGQVLKKS